MEKNVKEIKEKDNTKNRSLAFNTVALITIAVVIAIVVFLNVIFTNILPWQIDLTENQDFSMSEDAEELLKTIDKEVEIVGLFDEVKKDLGNISEDATYWTDLYLSGQLNVGTTYGDMYAAYQEYYVGVENSLSYMSIDSVMGILNQFSQTNPNIKVSYVDPEANPLFLQKFLGENARADEFEKGDFVVKCGNVFKRVTSVELCRSTISTVTGTKMYWPYAPNVDGGFLSAILYVTAEERPLIGVATNHGEIELENYFSILQTSLQDNVFDITTFNMATETDLSKYSIILMVDPASDITVGEADALKNYLANNGNLIVLADPKAQGTGGLEFTNLNSILAYFNLQLNNDKIQGAASEVIEGTDYLAENIIVSTTGPLMEVLDTSYQVQIPAARSITYLAQTMNSLDAGVVIKTSNNAYSYDYNAGKETAVGAKYIVAVAEDTSTNGGKVFLSGSASMFADGCATVGSSVDMLARVCTWMEESVNYSLPVKTYTAASITVTETSATVLGVVCVALLPILTFAIGIFIWMRRRHL